MQFPNPIVNQLVIYGSDGNPDVQIGPNPVITFYNGTNPQIQIGFFDGSQQPRFIIQNNVGDVLLLELDSLQSTPRIFMQDHDSAVGFAEIYYQYIAGGYQFLHVGVETDTGNDTWARFQEEGDGTRRILVNEPVNAIEPGTSIATEDWHAITNFSNGWINTGPPIEAGYRYYPDGDVMLRGRIQNGTVAAGTVLFTLPAGWRPSNNGRWTCAQGTNVANNVDPAIDITTAGVATLRRPITGAFIYLNNIRFSTL